MSDRRPRTAGLVLAAGRGARFGGAKMQAEIDGRPMLQHVLDVASASELDVVVVVLGEDADQIQAAIQWRNEIRVRNSDPGRGLASSLQLGLEAADAERALILLGDQPFITRENVRVLIGQAPDAGRPIVVPRYEDGRPGNPVLLEREAWRFATDIEGDRGMSQLFEVHPELVRYVDLPGTNPDIDTRGDLVRAASASNRVRRQRHKHRESR